jgi:adenine-specific DNA methylase
MWVLEEARKEVGHLYEDPEGRKIVGYLWARTAKCPNPVCGAEMPTVRQWWLAKAPQRKAAIKMIVDKPLKQVSFVVAEGNEINFDPDKGTMRQGSIVCPVCGQIPPENYLMEQGQTDRLGATLMAVITERAGGGKAYRRPHSIDFEDFRSAQHMLATTLSEHPDLELIEPIDPIRPSPNARGLSAVTRYGMMQWSKLFNDRQMMALLVFVNKLRAVHELIRVEATDSSYADAIISELYCVLSRMADKNSTLAVWNNSGEKI